MCSSQRFAVWPRFALLFGSTVTFPLAPSLAIYTFCWFYKLRFFFFFFSLFPPRCTGFPWYAACLCILHFACSLTDARLHNPNSNGLALCFRCPRAVHVWRLFAARCSILRCLRPDQGPTRPSVTPSSYCSASGCLCSWSRRCICQGCSRRCPRRRQRHCWRGAALNPQSTSRPTTERRPRSSSR